MSCGIFHLISTSVVEVSIERGAMDFDEGTKPEDFLLERGPALTNSEVLSDRVGKSAGC